MKRNASSKSKARLAVTDDRQSSPAAGRHTLHEILSQPATWRETQKQLERSAEARQILKSFSRSEPWLFVACGSSYYLAQVIASQWSQILSGAFAAVPASELLFAPDEVLRRTNARHVVLISRSGQTTEVLRAAELLKARNSIRTLGVTCNPSSALKSLCTHLLAFPWADEQSMVMTRSFTSILLVFEKLGAQFTGDTHLASSLDGLAEKTEQWLAANADKIRAFGSKRIYRDYVFLGQSAHYWLAQEAALKMTEMSSSYAQAYHTLEFRHGPKSIASADTLITFLLSDSAAQEESVMIGELKKLGAATMVVSNRGTPAVRDADLLVELDLDTPEYARMALTAIPGQLLGHEVGISKGLDPDSPKNLTRAVVLESNDGAAAKRSRA